MVLIASEEKHIIIFDATDRGRCSSAPLIVMILAAAESVPDAAIVVHEGDWPVTFARNDRHTADGSRLTEDDVITGVIHLVSSLQ